MFWEVLSPFFSWKLVAWLLMAGLADWAQVWSIWCRSFVFFFFFRLVAGCWLLMTGLADWVQVSGRRSRDARCSARIQNSCLASPKGSQHLALRARDITFGVAGSSTSLGPSPGPVPGLVLDGRALTGRELSLAPWHALGRPGTGSWPRLVVLGAGRAA